MIDIEATVAIAGGAPDVTVATRGQARPLAVPAKDGGEGSAVNGGELLALAVATCLTNDLFREARGRGIALRRVRVVARTAFEPAPGSAAQAIAVDVAVEGDASDEDLAALVRHTDTVAEVHNTLRRGCPVTLGTIATTAG